MPGMHVEFRGQLVGVDSFCHVDPGIKLRSLIWKHMLLSTEASCQPLCVLTLKTPNPKN